MVREEVSSEGQVSEVGAEVRLRSLDQAGAKSVIELEVRWIGTDGAKKEHSKIHNMHKLQVTRATSRTGKTTRACGVLSSNLQTPSNLTLPIGRCEAHLCHHTADFGAATVDAALDQLAKVGGAVRDELGVGRAAQFPVTARDGGADSVSQRLTVSQSGGLR